MWRRRVEMLVGTLVDALQIAELKATLVPAVVGALQSELTVALVPAAVVRVHLPHCHSEPNSGSNGDVPPFPYFEFEVIRCNWR